MSKTRSISTKLARDLDANASKSRRLAPTPPSPNPNQPTSRLSNVNDALRYLKTVRETFIDRNDVYDRFLDIMSKEFKNSSVDPTRTIKHVVDLFSDHPSLIQGFGSFLPPGYNIQCSTDDDGKDTVAITTPQQVETLRLYPSLEPSSSRRFAQPLPSYPRAPARASSPETSGILAQTVDTSSSEVVDAIRFAGKLRTKFGGDRAMYQQFLHTLETCRKEQQPLSDSWIRQQVAAYLKNDPDLTEELEKLSSNTALYQTSEQTGHRRPSENETPVTMDSSQRKSKRRKYNQFRADQLPSRWTRPDTELRALADDIYSATLQTSQTPNVSATNVSTHILETVQALQSRRWLDLKGLVGLVDLTGRVQKDLNTPPCNGSYGDVYRGVMKDRDQQVAIKIVRSYLADKYTAEQLKRHFCRELAIWRGLQHPNIVGLLGISHEFGPLPAMISPWFRNGNAMSYLSNHPNANRIKILRGVASGVKYMHEQKPSITHGDLKGENILISDDGEGLVCDFGVAKVARVSGHSSGFTTTAVHGTFVFMAPELHDDPVWTPATDVYAFAGTCMQIISGLRPFYNHKGSPIVAIVRGERPKRPENFEDNDLWDLLWQCWALDPSERPEMSMLCDYLHRSTQ